MDLLINLNLQTSKLASNVSKELGSKKLGVKSHMHMSYFSFASANILN
jgi:hypothetical protein